MPPVGLEFRQEDFFALRIPDAALAGVVAFYAYVHLEPEDLPRAFREVARVLRVDAPFLLGFNLGDEQLNVEEFLGAKVGLDWRFFPMPVVAGAIEDAGLRSRRAPSERATRTSTRPTEDTS